jgi:hypothetical protein
LARSSAAWPFCSFFKPLPEASVADVAADLGRSTTNRIAERLGDLGFLEANSTVGAGEVFSRMPAEHAAVRFF